ncbi:hypothetical protein OsI_36862 [Oryza sativa Indica Group]|uniref:BTB domain-containing protein n=1 Tax=Oryza sativa subsp. indica TaxID=39946 RepID=A2ZGF3_ORYSI|nr:hypothetical protein OsI_36862 [Oryza sativa Indica Group]
MASERGSRSASSPLPTTVVIRRPRAPPPPRSDQSTATRSFPRFITAKALEESGYLVGDSFSLRCDVAVVKDIRTEDDATTVKKLVGVPPPSDIGAHLGRLLAAGHGADVAIHVCGETFEAHRCVLAAQSPVFMAELFGPMAMSRHNNEETIRVHDMEPRVFEAMLHFIYNDSLPEVDDDDDGEVAAMAQHLLVAADSDQSTATRSFPRFITAKALEESGYLVGDSFSLRCDVAVVKDIRTEDDATTVKKLVGVPLPSDIGAHLGRLLAAGHGADVAIHVGGETFAAHRCVLAARSPVFMAELFGPMAMSRHNNEETIRVHDMEPRVFEAMLHFIYNDSLPEVDDDGEVAAMAQHLLVAADRYDMGRLKLICEDTLCSHVDASTAATALTLAEQHHCERLKEACFKFMENPSNLKAVMASDDFLHLTRSCSSLLKKLAKLAA